MHTQELIPIDSGPVAAILDDPQSFICGLARNGVLRRAYHFSPADRRIVAEVELLGKCQGPPQHVHGGLVASLLDEAMAVVLLHEQKVAVTGRMKIDFLLPCPFPASYRFEAWLSESDGLSALLLSRMTGRDGREMASASARFIWVD
jgi:acyl-coenzyme A thioesterase PaaI-like protein